MYIYIYIWLDHIYIYMYISIFRVKVLSCWLLGCEFLLKIFTRVFSGWKLEGDMSKDTLDGLIWVSQKSRTAGRLRNMEDWPARVRENFQNFIPKDLAFFQ